MSRVEFRNGLIDILDALQPEDLRDLKSVANEEELSELNFIVRSITQNNAPTVFGRKFSSHEDGLFSDVIPAQKFMESDDEEKSIMQTIFEESGDREEMVPIIEAAEIEVHVQIPDEPFNVDQTEKIETPFNQTEIGTAGTQTVTSLTKKKQIVPD